MVGRSLTTRLVAVIATVTGACVVMVATAVGWASYRNEEQHAIAATRVSSAHLSTGVAGVVDEAAQIARDHQSDLVNEIVASGARREHVIAHLREALSGEADLRGVWLLTEENAFDGRDADHRGAPGSTARGVFAPYWYRDAGGRIVQGRLGAGSGEAGERAQPFYRLPLERDRAVLVDPYVFARGAAPQAVLASVAAPVVADGRRIGVVGVDVPLADLSAELASQLREGQQFALVSEAGVVAASNDRSLIGRPASVLGLQPEALKALAAGEHAIGDWRGVSALVVSRDLQFAGLDQRWRLYVASPTAVALATARNMGLSALLFGGVSIVLAMLIAWRVGRALSKPVVVMAQTMRRMAEGDLDVRTPNARSSTELEGMAQALEAFRANARDLLEAESARRAAEKAARDRSEFLAVMSHEIRTPMNGVLGMADALSHTPLEPTQREMLSVLTSSGSTLLSLLNDILDYSKIEAGRVEIEQVPFSMEAVAREVADLFRPQAEAKGVALTLTVPRAIPRFVGDAGRVRQILHNLLSNAVKFTHEGSVRLAVGVRPHGAGSSELLVEVADTGIGIAPEVQARLFQKFVQGDASTTRAYGGTGLGLAISRELAQLMGGDITMRSRPGEGAAFTFRVRLPHADAAGTSVPAAASVPATEPKPLTGVRVLAAEDNANNRQVLQIMLDMVAADVTFAVDGAEAVRAWSQGAFDVILMDVQMPVMDGHAATREIRAREAAEGRARTPVIGVTANAMPHHVQDCLDAGMDAHVSKPIRPAELLAALCAALEAQDDAGRSSPAAVA
jgi:two-component system, sensor histidine kinase